MVNMYNPSYIYCTKTLGAEMKYKNETCSMLNGFKVTERVLDIPEQEAKEYAKEIKKAILEFKKK